MRGARKRTHGTGRQSLLERCAQETGARREVAPSRRRVVVMIRHVDVSVVYRFTQGRARWL
eukprot:5496851-Prymnesium_polylepis.1